MANESSASAARIPSTFIVAAALFLAMLGLGSFLYVLHGNAEDVSFRGRSAIRWMVARWSGAGGDLSHGWLIPLVSAFVIWRKRGDFAAADKQVYWLGLFVVAAALLLHLAGIRAQLTRVSLSSLILLLWGIPLFLFGRPTAKLLVFPCAYLFFCIPLSFLDSLTFPLRMLASATASFLLGGLGVPIVRVGTVIHSATPGGFALDVADACSGLRYVLAMLALAAAYAYLTQPTLARKWLLFAAALPVAVAANVFRILAIGIVAQLFGEEAAVGLYHDYSGYIVFAIGILLVMSVGSLLESGISRKLAAWRARCRSRRTSPL